MDGYKATIVSHGSKKDNYDFVGLSHIHSDDWDKQMIDLFVKDLLGYCYSEKELESKFFTGLDKIEAYIKKAIKDRLNKRIPNAQNISDADKVKAFAQIDGLCGEILLDIILKMEHADYQTLLCRPLYQQLGERSELKNYDTLLFTLKDSTTKLVLGQVKTGGFDYCKTGIKTDLDTKYKQPYFGEALCYVADKHMAEQPKGLEEIITAINSIAFESIDDKTRHLNICKLLKDKKVIISIPCVLFYGNKKVYENEKDIKKLVLEEREKIVNHFKGTKFDIADFSYEIIFYVFPAKDIDLLREAVLGKKLEVLSGN